jgi:hypothetical protein
MQQIMQTSDIRNGRSHEGRAAFHLHDLLVHAGGLMTRDLVVVVSDFRDTAPDDAQHGWHLPLHNLARKGNSIIALETTNPEDFALDESFTRFDGGEGGRYATAADREQYTLDAAKQQQSIDTAIGMTGIAHAKLSTAEPQWLSSLMNVFKKNASGIVKHKSLNNKLYV